MSSQSDFMNRWIYSSGITLWSLTCEVKFWFADLIWNIFGSKWTFSPQGSCVRSRKKRGSMRIWLFDKGQSGMARRRGSEHLLVWRQCDALGKVLLGKRESLWVFSDGRGNACCHGAKRFRNGSWFTTMILRRSLGLQIPRSQFSRASVRRVGQKSQIYGGPSSQLTGPEGSDMLVPDSTAHHQESGVVHASAWSQGCFGSWRRTNTMLGRWL